MVKDTSAPPYPIESSMEVEIQNYLAKTQEEERQIQLPCVIMLALFFVVGCAGNMLVLLVYGRGFRKGPFRVVILLVTAMDLFSCVVLMPVDLVLIYVWEGEALCKMRQFLNGAMAVGSTLALVQVAVFRYRKVCHPFGWQLTSRRAATWSIIILLFAALAAFPLLILKGPQLKFKALPDSLFRDIAVSVGSTKNLSTPGNYSSISEYSILVCENGKRLGDEDVTFQGEAGYDNTSTASTCNKTVSLSRDRFVVYGYACTTDDAWVGSTFPMVMNVLLFLGFVTTSTSMMTMYILISREFKSMRNKPKILEVEWNRNGQTGPRRLLRMFSLTERPPNFEAAPAAPCSITDTTSFNSSAATSPSADVVVDPGGIAAQYSAIAPGETSEPEWSTEPTSPSNDMGSGVTEDTHLFTDGAQSSSGDETNTNTNLQEASRPRKRGSMFKGTNVMLMVISAMYIVGNFTHIVAATIKTSDPKAFESSSPAAKSACFFFLRLFYINCAANPVVYSLWDPGFRQQCLRLLKRS